MKIVPDPRFSVEVFFGFLTCMMVVSLIAFLLLNFWPGCTEEHADNRLIVATNDEDSTDSGQWTAVTKRKFILLLLINVYICFLSNGAFPSIQTYSCLPYGNLVYHLSVTLHAMANPAMAFFAFFVPCTKLRSILGLTFVGSIFAAYLLATALYSPDMLWGQQLGGTMTVLYTDELIYQLTTIIDILQVLSWIVYGGLFAYVKISIAGICRQTSNSALFWCGAVTQIGSAFGALLMFILVNEVTGLFSSYQVNCN